MTLRFIFLIATLPVIHSLHAQDTVVKPSVRIISKAQLEADLPYHDLDSGSNRMELYHPLRQQYLTYNDLGNIGLPARTLHFDISRNTGFNYGFVPHGVYFFNAEKTTYVNTRTPFTDISFVQGGNELLILKVKHAQNILPRWNAGIDYHRITSQGFLLRQYSSLYGLNAFTTYASKDKRYLLLANFISNSGLNEESGGIRYDSTFEKLTGSQKQVFTNLANSETHFHNREFFAKQLLRFGSSRFIETGKDSVYDFTTASQWVHTLHASQLSYAFYNYGDTNSVLLPARYYDLTLETYDSIFLGKLSNSLTWQKFYNGKGFILPGSKSDLVRSILGLGIRHEIINVAQPAYVRRLQNWILEGNFQSVGLSDQQVRTQSEIAYVVSGYNQGDYKLRVHSKLVYSGFRWLFEGGIQRFRCDFAAELYKSNQFIWNNPLKQVQTSYARLGLLQWKQFSLVATIRQLNNWVYFGFDARPAQINKNIGVYSVNASKTFTIWKLKFEHELLWQKSSSDSIRFPEYSGMIRYYFQSRFYGISRFQLGFNLFYNTRYQGEMYNPATRQFFLQNQISIGSYPVFSPFFIADIKRVSLFVTYEHINMDQVKKGMYYTVHYPIDLSSMRMGVRWRFYD